MRIDNLARTQGSDLARVSASVIWEECDRPPFDLYFATEGLAAPDLASDPHAFLVACLLPAMQFGERRIRIAEEVCPELLNGLETNMRWYEYWSGGQLHPVQIECPRSRVNLSSHKEKRAGSFLSGGIDSLATLRTNRLDYPLDHQASVRDCVVVHGFDIGGTTRGGTEQSFFDRSAAALRDIARDAEVELIPITTNVRLLHDDVAFWMHYFHGAALASVAHTLSRRLARIYIASSFLTSPVPWGSHPLTDPNYGSYALQIRHDGLHLTRLEKAQVVANWDVALRNLRVCTDNPEKGLNCGVCEKCVRTMLELLAVGKLDGAESFPTQRIPLDALDMLEIREDYEATFYHELLEPLAASGHAQIADCIEGKLAKYEKYHAWEMEDDLKGIVKRVDRRYLGSALYRTWKGLRSHALKLVRREATR